MESVPGRPTVGRVIKGEMGTNHEERPTEYAMIKICDEDRRSKPTISRDENHSSSKEGYQLQYAKAEMGKVKRENQRLKIMLQKMNSEYQTLQMSFCEILKEQQHKPEAPDSPSGDQPEEPEISLCLGRSPVAPSSRSRKANEDDNKLTSGGDLALRLEMNCSYESNLSDIASDPGPGIEKTKKNDQPGASQTSSKGLKTNRSGSDDLLQSDNVKRSRVSVRTRCDGPTIDDGCQWRKYGQKIAKGNPCPRAYYRCTVAPSCPVRKQVQRNQEDMSILITTYEGTHNHPLPVAATAMASTTLAAASILTCGSSTSQRLFSETSPAKINGLDFTFSDSFRVTPFSSYSAPLAPTITLDLTKNPSQFNKLYRAGFSQFDHYFSSSTTSSSSSSSSPSLDFTSSSCSEPTKIPTGWRTNNGYHLTGSSWQSSTKNPIGAFNFAKSPIRGNVITTSPSKMEPTQSSSSSFSCPSQPLFADTLTKALSSDPSFGSAVAAAISSMNGTGYSGNNVAGAGGGGGNGFGESLKWKRCELHGNQLIKHGMLFNPLSRNEKAVLPTDNSMFSQHSMSIMTSSPTVGGKAEVLQPPTGRTTMKTPFLSSDSKKSSSNLEPGAADKDQLC